MTIPMPYFMKNKEWYTKDKEGHYTLTDKAPPEARESLKEYNDTVEWYENLIYEDLK